MYNKKTFSVFFIFLSLGQVAPVSMIHDYMSINEINAAATSNFVWMLSHFEDFKGVDTPEYIYETSDNFIEIEYRSENIRSVSRHVIPEMPEVLVPGDIFEFVVSVESKQFTDSYNTYPGSPTDTAWKKKHYISTQLGFPSDLGLEILEAWFYEREAPGEDEDSHSYEYRGETISKQYSWKVYDNSMVLDWEKSEMSISFSCQNVGGWITRYFIYKLGVHKTDVTYPSVNMVKMLDPDKLIWNDEIQVVNPSVTPDCRGGFNLYIGIWLEDLQYAVNYTIEPSLEICPFILRTSSIENRLFKEYEEDGSKKSIYYLFYDVLFDPSYKYPEKFVISIKLDAFVNIGEGDTRYISPVKTLEVMVQQPKPLKLSFQMPPKNTSRFNLLEPIHLNLDLSLDLDCIDLESLGYTPEEDNYIIYQTDITLNYIKKEIVNSTGFPLETKIEPIKFKIKDTTASYIELISSEEYVENNSIILKPHTAFKTYKYSIELEIDNSKFKYWPDTYLLEIGLSFKQLSNLKVLTEYIIDEKTEIITTNNTQLTPIQNEVIVQIDPEIREEVREYLAQRWYKRFKELDARTGNTTVNSIDEMYDILDQHEEFLNLHCALTELTMSLTTKGTHLYKPGDMVDNFEDGVDFGKCLWLMVNGYAVESLTDAVFKLIPDLLCDQIIGIVGKTVAITVSAPAGAGIGGTLGGPIGGVVGGLLGYYIGSKGAEAAEGVCEVGAAFIENWWNSNKEYWIQKLGSETRQNIVKWDKKGRPFYDENDARLWGIGQYKSNGLLHVYDSTGRHMGPTASGEVEAEIPGSVYVYLPEEKTAVFCIGMQSNPLDEYVIEVECTDPGHYDLLLTAASRANVTTLIDIENAEMYEGQTIVEKVDTIGLWENLDLEPPEIIDVSLSGNLVTEIDDLPSITVTATDNDEVYYVLAALLKNTFPVAYLTLVEDGGGAFTGRMPVSGDLINGDYTLEIQAYDHQNNVASETIPVTVDLDLDATGGFFVSDLDIQPTKASPGETVYITGEITNQGSEDGVYDASLVVNGDVVSTLPVEIEAGGTETVKWHTTEQWGPGSYEVTLGDKTMKFEILDTEETDISIYIPSYTSKKGEPVTISGYVSPARENGIVRVFVRHTGGDWLALDDVELDEDGYYSCTWTPSSTGTYEFVTSLLDEGGTEILPSTTRTILVEEPGGIPGFSPLSLLVGALFTILLLSFYTEKTTTLKRI